MSANETMLKAARLLASVKSELSQQALMCQFLAAWKIISKTRFLRHLAVISPSLLSDTPTLLNTHLQSFCLLQRPFLAF
jgi:hypothetical protein